MAKLYHNSNLILSNMRVAQSSLSLAIGLMFASKKRVSQGLCLVFPAEKDVMYGATVTMWFCFFSYEIIFVNSKYQVVDKVTLRPWKMSYVPQEKCRYVIECLPSTFNSINVGDRVKIVF